MHIPSANPKLLNLNQDHHSKKEVFLGKSWTNRDYDNFFHGNAIVIKLRSVGHIHNIIWVMSKYFVDDVIDIIYNVIAFTSEYPYFKNALGSHFWWHYQNLNFFLQQSLKTQEKYKELKMLYQNAIYTCIS